MSAHLTRRAFLHTAGAGAGALLLAACQPPAAPTAATEPTKAPEPAAAEPTAVPPTAAPAVKKHIIFSSYTWSGYEAAMRSIIDAWAAEHPDVEVEGQFVPDDYWTKVQTQVAGGTPPDVGIADYGRLLVYAKNGTLLPITEMVARDSFPVDKMLPAAVAQYRWRKGDFDTGGEGGDLYGLPSDAQGFIFAYNKTMFDEAGVAYPTDDWTWDDLVAAGQAITEPDANKWGVLAIPNWILLMRGNFVSSAGGRNFSADYKSSMLDSAETIEAVKWSWDLIYTHKIAPPPGTTAQTNPFMSGQVAMIVDGVWWLSDFMTVTDFDWDIALFPKHPRTGKRTTSLESDGWWVFSGTKERETSWQLLQALAGEKGQARFGELNYVVPSCFPDVGKQWYAQTPPASRAKALDNLVLDSQKVFCTHYEFFTIWDAYAPFVDAAFADGTDVEAALKDAAQVHNEELAKAWDAFSAS